MARSYRDVETRRTVVEQPAVAPADSATAVGQTDVVTTDPYGGRRNAAYMAMQAVYLIFGVLEGLIAIRFILKALGANPNAGFSSFIYNLTDPFLAPFAGMFGNPTATNGGVFELHTLIAFIVYALVAWVVAKLVWLALGDHRTGVVSTARDVEVDQRLPR